MSSTPSEERTTRQDLTALWTGILFSLGFIVLIWQLGPRLDTIQLAPDTGASWYYWKLPNPTFWTRVTAWGLYLLHQFSFWGLIYYAQARVKKYSTKLHWVNYAALGMNALFILLRILQTHLWYDGLAQDVSIWSSQASVAILLIWILLMENRTRGMFFGKSLPLSKEIIRFARKYHGYFFAWATVYTFWYHPTIATSGHLVGFLYMFLLLLQGSLFFTRIHVNRWWMIFQEVSVLVHGTLVAVMQGNNMWPMFAFGFGGVFVITQMHGLKIPKWSRWTILGVYLALALFVYSSRDITMIHQITWIPIIDYLVVLLLAGIIGGILLIKKKAKKTID
jgi:hypothetical protein